MRAFPNLEQCSTLLRIGPHLLANPVLLAPMAGLTDAAFRKIALDFGAGYAVCEMVNGKSDLWLTDKSRLRRQRAEGERVNARQIAGGDPSIMAEVARRLESDGADVIDINFGCPVKKVCRKAAGSALMRQPELIGRIVDAVVNGVSVPVTVKMRTGWAPDERNAVEVALIAEQAGARALVVHGRTRACRFTGDAEYATVAEVKRQLQIPVIANGDIDTRAKARWVMDTTGVDGVMIGRAALGAPWLPGCVAGRPEPNLRTKWGTVFNHLESIYTLYGIDQGVKIARKHVRAYLVNLGFTGAEARLFNQLTRIKEQQAYLGHLAA